MRKQNFCIAHTRMIGEQSGDAVTCSGSGAERWRWPGPRPAPASAPAPAGYTVDSPPRARCCLPLRCSAELAAAHAGQPDALLCAALSRAEQRAGRCGATAGYSWPPVAPLLPPRTRAARQAAWSSSSSSSARLTAHAAFSPPSRLFAPSAAAAAAQHCSVV